MQLRMGGTKVRFADTIDPFKGSGEARSASKPSIGGGQGVPARAARRWAACVALAGEIALSGCRRRGLQSGSSVPLS